VCVRLIKPSTLRQWSRRFADPETALTVWQTLIEAGDFPHFTALRQVFPAANQVTVESGRTVTVFNLRRNRYRLVAAVHYNRSLVYALRFLTHADYSKDRWKDDL
jgi:mRNA interferase HigB